MYKKWSLVVGAGLSLLALPLCVVKADDPAGGVKPAEAREAAKPLAFPAGFELKDGTPDAGIRSGLAKLTERAVTKGDFNSMLGELSRPDRERAREFKGVDQTKLDVQIDRIQQAWKAKYGKDFKIDADAVFGAPLLIYQGTVVDPATALTNWPLPACSEHAITASGRVPANDKEVTKEAKEEKLEKGRNVAIVRFPATAGSPDLTVSMIHHLPAFWRIDIQNDRTGDQIYNDLLAQLTWLGDHTDQWPADVNEAYRHVAWHVTSAVYGVNMAPAPSKG
jgi:hypothetical protein